MYNYVTTFLKNIAGHVFFKTSTYWNLNAYNKEWAQKS